MDTCTSIIEDQIFKILISVEEDLHYTCIISHQESFKYLEKVMVEQIPVFDRGAAQHLH